MDSGGAFKKVASNSLAITKFRKVTPHRSKAAYDVTIKIEHKDNGTGVWKNGYLAVNFSSSIINQMHWPGKATIEVLEGIGEYAGILAFKLTKFAGGFYLRQYKRGGRAVLRIPLDRLDLVLKENITSPVGIDYQIDGDVLQITIPVEV